MGCSKGVFSELEKLAPGSVHLAKDGSSITLIGWHLEEFECPDGDECKPGKNQCLLMKKGCSVQEKNKRTYEDHHLVPVIQGKFTERVLHFFNHLIQKISRDFKHISKGDKRG